MAAQLPAPPNPQVSFQSRYSGGGDATPRFRIYALPDKESPSGIPGTLGALLNSHYDGPLPPTAERIAAYRIYSVKITNSGAVHVRGDVSIKLVPADDRYVAFGGHEQVVECSQEHREPDGPHLDLVGVTNEKYASLPPEVYQGVLDLHPDESVDVSITTVVRERSVLLGSPQKATVRMRGVTVVEEQEEERLPRRFIDEMVKLATDTMRRRQDALVRRARFVVGGAFILGSLLGLCWSRIAASIWSLAAAGPVWLAIGGLSFIASIAASVAAGLLLLQNGRQELKRARFLIVAGVGLAASFFSAYLASPQ